MEHPVLDRIVPSDWKHVDRYALRLAPVPVEVPAVVETSVRISTAWRRFYDQGNEGKCVVFSQAQIASLHHRVRFNPHPWYEYAQLNDEFSFTPPQAGTSLRAGFDGWRANGLVRAAPRFSVASLDMPVGPYDDRYRILENRWATSVDEIRALIAAGVVVQMGTWWCSQMNRSRLVAVRHGAITEHRVVRTAEGTLGRREGGHAWILNAASDRRNAVRFPNTWGLGYPQTWIDYEDLRRLLDDDGEGGFVSSWQVPLVDNG